MTTFVKKTMSDSDLLEPMDDIDYEKILTKPVKYIYLLGFSDGYDAAMKKLKAKEEK